MTIDQEAGDLSYDWRLSEVPERRWQDAWLRGRISAIRMPYDADIGPGSSSKYFPARDGKSNILVIDRIVFVWFAITAISVLYVAWDAFTRNPEMQIMRVGWVLVTLFLGPVSAVFYILSCREPAPGEHEKFVAPMWKQALGSTIHCVAGDATGIVAAATLTALLGLPMQIDFVVEYVAGFAFGLLIFQSLFMKDAMGLDYPTAVRKSFLPEFISMNMMMTGMFPTMVYFMMVRDMRAMQPTQPLFWATMSLAVGVGLVTAYPVNWWLVAAGLKHGMATVRVFGKGGERPAETSIPSPHGSMPMGAK